MHVFAFPLLHLLVLHPPVLEPDLHLPVRETEALRYLLPLLPRDEVVAPVLPLQRLDLRLRVRLPLLPGVVIVDGVVSWAGVVVVPGPVAGRQGPHGTCLSVCV